MKKSFQKQKKGFMLIELAIVIIILGLLFSGVAGGVGLIEKAKVFATVRQIKKLENDILLFRISFDAKPGLLLNTRDHFPNSITDGVDNTKWVCERENLNGGASLAADGETSGFVHGIMGNILQVNGLSSGISMQHRLFLTAWPSIAMCQLYVSKISNINALPGINIIPTKNSPALLAAKNSSLMYINDSVGNSYLIIGDSNIYPWMGKILRTSGNISGSLLKKLAVKINSGSILQDKGKLRAAAQFSDNDGSIVSTTNCSYDSNTKGCVGLYKLSD